LGGGWLLDAAAGRLAILVNRWTETPGTNLAWSHGIVAFGCTLLLALPIAAATGLDMALSQVDHRELAGRWVDENIEPGTKVAIEHYSIPFSYGDYDVEDILRATDHDLGWYLQEGFEILIISDGVWPILQQQPETYAQKMDAYQALTGNCTLLAEFVPEPPAFVTAGYPTVAVYHFAPVRIFRLPEGE
jgi:hypothetical protein